MAQTKVKLISDGVIDVGHLASGHGITTDNIGEGSNLYYTDARVSTYLSTNSYATEGYVTTAVANLVDSAPTTLDTLNELAAALGDDPNFATTVTNSIATKLPLAGGTLTGQVVVSTASSPGFKISKNASTDNRFLRLENTESGGRSWDIINQTVANSNALMFYNHTDNIDAFQVLSNGNTIIKSGNENTLRLVNYSSQPSLVRFSDTSTSNDPYIGSYGNDLAFGIYGVGESMRINSSRNVGIGTTSPNEKLSVNGAIRTTGATTSNESSATIAWNNTPNEASFESRGKDNTARGKIVLYQSYANGSNGLRVLETDSSGNIGIGTSPSAKLDILGATQDQLRLRTAGTEHYRIGRDSSDGLLYFYGSQSGYTGYVFSGVNGERMRIDSSGTTHIKTTKAYGSQTAGLRVQTTPTGTNYADGAWQTIVFGDETVANSYLGQLSVVQENASASTASTMRFYTNSGGGNGATQEKMRITSAGDVGIGTTTINATYLPKLEIASTASDGTGGLLIGSYLPTLTFHDYSGGATIGQIQQDGTGLVFKNNGSERMRITDDGKVLINQTSSLTGQALQVNGFIDQTATTAAFRLYNGSTFVGGIGNGQWAYATTYLNDYAVYATNDLLFSSGGGGPDMILNASGDVGIGTTSPLLTNPGRGNLTINGSADSILTLGVGGTHKAWYYTTSTNTYLSSTVNLQFEAGSAVRMYVASGGNVGINTTSPAVKLHVGTAALGASGGAPSIIGSDGVSCGSGSRISVDTGYYTHGYMQFSGATWGSESAYGLYGYYGISLNTRSGSGLVVRGDTNRIGVKTTSPEADLDVNGSTRFRGDTYNEYTFTASGNYTSGTWYDAADTSTLTASGIYIIQMYLDDYGAGGGTYFCWYVSVPFMWVTTGTNRTSIINFPELIGTGHATGTLPTFRLTQELGTAGAKSRIQFNPNNNWTTINNTSGRTFRVYFKRIGG